MSSVILFRKWTVLWKVFCRIQNGIQRCGPTPVHKFSVIFWHDTPADKVYVVAYAHPSRRPHYWARRKFKL